MPDNFIGPKLPFEECLDCPAWAGYECDDCIEGRYLPVLNEYASTCDGCGELEMHENQTFNPEDQLGYCDECLEVMTKPGN